MRGATHVRKGAGRDDDQGGDDPWFQNISYDFDMEKHRDDRQTVTQPRTLEATDASHRDVTAHSSTSYLTLHLYLLLDLCGRLVASLISLSGRSGGAGAPGLSSVFARKMLCAQPTRFSSGQTVSGSGTLSIRLSQCRI